MNDMKKELADMLDTYQPGAGAGSDTTDSPGTDAPGTDPPGTAAPSTDSPSTDAPATDAPGTSAPATDAPTTAAPDDEDDRFTSIKAENELLKSRLDKLEKGSTTDAPGTSAPTTSAPIEAQDFIGDIDLDELTRDKDQFNLLLNKVLTQGVEIGRTEIRRGNEQVLLATPEVARKNVEIVLALKEANDTFYAENKDLAPFKKVVAVVMEEEMAKNPDKLYSEIMGDVATETRERLELVKKTGKKDDDPPPKLPKGKGQNRGARQKPNTNALASEIGDMNTALAED